jgi:uncharacterized protein with HEPN domain
MSVKKQKREVRDYLNDIINAVDDINDFCKQLSYSEFQKDKKTIYAVIRCLEVIGEAIGKIPTEIKNQHKEIPWKEISGMRNKLIHEYFGVDTETVWYTIQDDLSPLEKKVKFIFKNLSE